MDESLAGKNLTSYLEHVTSHLSAEQKLIGVWKNELSY